MYVGMQYKYRTFGFCPLSAVPTSQKETQHSRNRRFPS